MVSLVPANGWVALTNVAVTVNNTAAADKRAYIQFAADVGIALNAEVRLGFAVDGATPGYAGPQNLANAAQYWQTRSSLATVLIPPGSHTITPHVFVSGGGGEQAFVDDRCMFVTL